MLSCTLTTSSFETSRAFVLNKARVIMINHKEGQGQDAINRIKNEAGNDAKIEWIPAILKT